MKLQKLKSDNPLGKTGLRIPKVIYGTSYLGNLYKALSYEEKLAIIKKWFECTEKPVVIDSAGKYGAGMALEVIGKGLAELGINPEEIVISNKLGWYRVPLKGKEPLFEPGAWVGIDHDAVPKFGYNGIMECYEQGNDLLGGTYKIDLVSVHDPDEYLFAARDNHERDSRYNEIIESYGALMELKQKGMVRAVGIGSKDWKIIRELYQDVKFDWVMLANSYTIYSHPEDLLSFMNLLKKDGVGIVNSAVFHGGFLTGSDKFDYQDVDMDTEKGKKLYGWRNAFYRVCDKYNIPPSEACILYGISHPAIAGIALNTSNPDKMNQNVKILNKVIPQEFWKELTKNGLI